MERGSRLSRPSIEFFQGILQKPESVLARRYSFDYGIPKEARITEHTLPNTESFFHGVTTSNKFATRLNPLTEKHLTIHNEPKTADFPITNSDVVITKAREITTNDGPLYIRILLIKNNGKITQLEMYSNKPKLADVLESTKKVTVIAPKLVTYALEGTNHVYDAAYKEGEVAIRIIDPVLESVFQYGDQLDTEKDTQKILDATKKVTEIFLPPITPENFIAPTTEAMETYLHHEYLFNVEQTWNGFDFSSEKKFDQVDFGEGISADIFCYRVRNKETGKVTRLVTTQSIYEAHKAGREIKEAKIRPDTKCACHINPDTKCGCDIEFRTSLRQGIKDDPNSMIMIALDTNGVGLNNGLLGLHEQYAFKSQDPTLTPELRDKMMAAAKTDHRNFADQVNILLTVAMKLKIPNLGIIATNGNKVNTFIDQIKHGSLKNEELPEELISIYPDVEFYGHIQEQLPAGRSRLAVLDESTYKPTRRTPTFFNVNGRSAFVDPFAKIYISGKHR